MSDKIIKKNVNCYIGFWMRKLWESNGFEGGKCEEYVIYYIC